jgi:hypothetical protein
MGPEAGQPLHAILARKDAERQLGKGVFFWGIGSSLGSRMWSFTDSVVRPQVIFTPMRAKPKEIDVSPKRVCVWRNYIDRYGTKYPMPNHVLVTGRVADSGPIERVHYALVCKKETPLVGDTWPKLSWNVLTNFGLNSKVAYSQVTALVQVGTNSNSIPETPEYEVVCVADLVAPYHVRLADPVELPQTVLQEINRGWEVGSFAAAEWQEYLRTRGLVSASPEPNQLTLY